MNVFRQHREKILAQAAARQATKDGHSTMDAANAANIYDQMLAQLAAHKVELKAIQSLKAKAKKKAAFIPEYEGYVEGVLAADEDVQDDVVVTVLIWAIDAGQIDYALEIAEWALKYDLDPPAGFDRSLASIVVEEIADSAAAHPQPDKLEGLERVNVLVKDKDVPDPVRAKMYKALGLLSAEENPEQALEYYQLALEYNPKAGVKKTISKLLKSLAKTPPAPDLADSATVKTPVVKPAATDGEAAVEPDQAEGDERQ